jgi:hypothetical protein
MRPRRWVRLTCRVDPEFVNKRCQLALTYRPYGVFLPVRPVGPQQFLQQGQVQRGRLAQLFRILEINLLFVRPE